MSLASPVVVQPISVWSKKLLVTGAMFGATIEVRSIGPNARAIAKATSLGGWDWLDLLPTVVLQADDLLVANQHLGADTSPWTPKAAAYSVNSVPTSAAELGAVTLQTYPWECGQCVWITGAEPGSTVQVSIGATDLGHADAPLGWASFKLTGKLTAPGPVTVRQKTPIGLGPAANLEVHTLPFASGQPLPPPEFDGPLGGCEDFVKVRKVIDGASVTINLSTGEIYSLDAPFERGTVFLPKPLVYNASIPQTATLAQTMPLCERRGNPGGPASVGPPDVTAPYVLGLCAGNMSVTVGGLNPKATVIGRVFLDGAEFQTFTVHGESSHTCELDTPLVKGAVYATQEICGNTGNKSPDQPIDEHPAITQGPTLLTPLYSCQRRLKLKDVHVGVQLQAFAKSHVSGAISAISPRVVFGSTVGDIDVTPVLKQGDDVWVVAIGCGTNFDSNHEQVQAHPAIAGPKIQEPVKNDDKIVRVVGTIPTASVYVFVRETNEGPWRLAGSMLSADGGADYVGVDKPLKTGWLVAASQYYCEVDSGRGPTATVVKQEPLPPHLISPSNMQSKVSLTPSFVWSDPGVGSDRKADSFNFALKHFAQSIHSAPGLTGTAYTPAGVTLAAGTTYNWSVAGHNSTGNSVPASASFTTLAPTPNLTAYDQTTFTLKGNNFPPNTQYTLHYKFLSSSKIPFGDIQLEPDNRSGTVTGTFTSDGSGNVNQVIDLTTTTQSYQFLVPEPGGAVQVTLLGPLKGDTVHFQAIYATPNAGMIPSNDLTFPWTNAFVKA